MTAIRKLIKVKYGEKCDDEEILKSLERIICERFDPLTIKPYKPGRSEKKPKKVISNGVPRTNSSEEVEKKVDISPEELN
ncbi:MAG: hypothetical protein H7X94_08680 [Vallitaleaceae bacterium]|nr:hypothetical protein [Vallitaleaceae bacterium]